jgi:hypothetical protein
VNINIKIKQVYSPPAGYSVHRVKRWGEDDVMLRNTWDVRQRGGGGQFSMVEPYLVRADGSWVGQWGAISNYSRLTHADMLSISNWQFAEQASETQYFDVNQKMAYLYQPQDGTPGTEIWGDGNWSTTVNAKYGHMVHAGQLVALSDALTFFNVKMPGELSRRDVVMRELLMFRRSDFSKSFASHPWLVQKATVSLPMDSYPWNRYGDYPRGTVYMCVMLDPQDFPANNGAVKAFIPVEWTV